MTAEELAMTLAENYACDFCRYKMDDECGDACHQGICEWLAKEADE